MRHLIVAASLAAALATGALATGALAEVPGNSVKIGVLSDFSGPFADQAGKGSLIAAQMAAEDFAKESKGLKAEIIFADHQNKPDVGSAIARRWVDQENVAAVVDLPNSGVALAVNTVMKEKNRTMLASGSATSDLTGGHLGARQRHGPGHHRARRQVLVLRQLRLRARQGAAA
jgi:branched-chain amino acid transport system substrate-binding protein